MTNKAYSYIRFSTTDQAKGDSKRRQLAASEAWAKRMGLTIDRSLSLSDLGVSAFKGKNAKVGALAAFMDAIQSGRVKRGETLIVEAFDRLTRQAPLDSFDLISRILRAGITIATMMDGNVYSEQSVNNGQAQILLGYLQLGHFESKQKAERLGKAWEQKRTQIGDRKLTGAAPSWLSLSTDKRSFSLNEHAATVRRIFQMSIDGVGSGLIAKELNREQVPTIGRASVWHASYVKKILDNRSVIGEYQPHRGRAGDRKPIGKAIVDYYPSVVDEATFYRAQAALKSRRNAAGRRGREGTISNLFTGLIVNATDGASMIHRGPSPKSPSRLMSAAALRGEKGASSASFPYLPFELAVMGWMSEIKPSDILPPTADATNAARDLEAAEAKLASLTAKAAKVDAQIRADDGADVDYLLSLRRDLESDKRQAAAKAEELRTALHSSHATDMGESQRLVDLVLKSKADTAIRAKLRAKLRALIAGMTMRVEIEGAKRTAHVEIRFISKAVRHLSIRVDSAAHVKHQPRDAKGRIVKGKTKSKSISYWTQSEI